VTRKRGSYAPSSSTFRNVPTRCYGCNLAKHTACERRLDTDASCTCQCVGRNGKLEWWALVETAENHPESAATHAAVAGTVLCCYLAHRLSGEDQ
jgi:hypothetical protein